MAGLQSSDWSLAPGDLTAITELIATNGLRTVVELGAGWSTLALAETVARQGGTLISVEHDEAWAARVRESLAEANFRDVVVIAAPLEPHPLAPGGPPWYAGDALTALPAGIDLLVVDGPPGGDPKVAGSRYPALPALLPKLAGDALVVLDDADRPGEREVLRRWEADTGFRFRRREGGRIAVGSAA
jgi:predicted O-methyltransferase YrrM